MERTHESSQAMHVENIGRENSELEQVQPLKGLCYPCEATILTIMLKPDHIFVSAFKRRHII